ncbi:MAG: DUF2169 domain-containing protein [Ectothiorhodospiraceae bacterium]|nr:DUF2169 domain-containing protein [Ectothiorhodospiraceae bacterium]
MCVSMLWGFQLDSNIPVLEQDLWTSIGNMLGKNEMFDMGMPKPNAEALVHGSFFAPNGTPVEAGVVSFTMASIEKELAVFGHRHWVKTFGATTGVSSPMAMTEMPVSYANAFGGKEHASNPIGKGIDSITGDDGEFTPLPNIEFKNKLVGSTSDRPYPAAFSRLDISWPERIKLAGTYDQKYIDEQMPGLPDDIDWRHFNDAPKDQWIEGFFTGRESFTLKNMNPETPIQKGQLPKVYGRCFVHQKINDDETRFVEIETRLDTVWFFPEDNLGVLIHRGTLEVSDSESDDIINLLVAHEGLDDTPRTVAHYEDQVIKRTDQEEGFKYLLNSTPLIPENEKCGFKLLDEKANFPLDLESRKHQENFAEQKQKEAMAQIDTQISDLEAKMSDAGANAETKNDLVKEQLEQLKNLKNDNNAVPSEELPEVTELKAIVNKIAPGVLDDPFSLDIAKLDLKAMDELKEFNENLAKKKTQEAMDMAKNELQTIKSAYADDPTAAEALKDLDIFPDLDDTSAPQLPRMDVNEHITELERQFQEEIGPQIMQAKSQGIPDDMLGHLMFDGDEIRKQLDFAQEKFIEGYRIGAHYAGKMTSPHPGQEPTIMEKALSDHESGKSLSTGDYAYTEFVGQNLSGADFSHSLMEYASFKDCNLTDINFEGAILANAKFINCVITTSNFKGANVGACQIDNTNFNHCDMTGIILGKSHLKNSQFNHCQLVDKPEMFLETSFTNTAFTGSNLAKNNFIDFDLSGCDFSEANLAECNFVNCSLESTSFQKAVLTSANFVKAEAKGAIFNHADMKNVRFVGGCNLENSQFVHANIPESNFRECNLVAADFSDAALTKTDFGKANLRNAKFLGAVAVQAQFNKADLSFATLHRINLMEGSFYKTCLTGAKLVEANLYGVNFIEATVGKTDFTGACLEQTVLKDWRPS